jgi:hypothetical protein
MKTTGMMTTAGMLALVLAGAGCAGTRDPGADTKFVIVTPTGGGPGGTTTRYDLEKTGKLVLLDKGVEQSVTYPSVLERVREDGRLEVIANVKNKLNRRIEVQISCVFKDETGFASNDDAPFQTLILTENAEEAARFVSLNDQARTYTIRIRQAR